MVGGEEPSTVPGREVPPRRGGGFAAVMLVVAGVVQLAATAGVARLVYPYVLGSDGLEVLTRVGWVIVAAPALLAGLLLWWSWRRVHGGPAAAAMAVATELSAGVIAVAVFLALLPTNFWLLQVVVLLAAGLMGVWVIVGGTPWLILASVTARRARERATAAGRAVAG